MASAAPGTGGMPRPASATNLHRVPSNPGLQQLQPGQTVLVQRQPGQAPVPATVAVMKQQPQQPIAVVMKVDPSQPGAATMMVPAGTGAAALLPAGTPVQVVQQLPAQVALQQGQPGATAILQVQQPPQPPAQQPQPQPQPQPASAAAAAAAAVAAVAGQQGGQQVNTLPQAFEKKLRRLEKNRESARECRRRKKEHVLELQKQVARLEAENLRLKLQLKVGEESEAQERQEKERITKKLDEMVKSGASEADIWQTIDMFKERYSDYGSDRRSAIEFHTNQLEKLLLPTKLTKLCMWMLLHMNVEEGEEGEDAPLPSLTEAMASVPALKGPGEGEGGEAIMPPPAPPAAPPQGSEAAAAGEAQPLAQAEAGAGAGGAAGAAGRGGSEPPAPQAARRLWATVAAELGVTEAQQRQLLAQRATVTGMDRDLQVTSGMLADLRALIADKNATLDQELLEVQKILTPTQTAKFILWITKNPACMHMLNQLWRFVYEKAPVPGGGPGAASAASASAASSGEGGAAPGGEEEEWEGPALKRVKVEPGNRNGNGAAVATPAEAVAAGGQS